MAVLKNRMKFKIFAVRICTYKEHKMTPFTPQIRKRPVYTAVHTTVCVFARKNHEIKFMKYTAIFYTEILMKEVNLGSFFMRVERVKKYANQLFMSKF